MKKKLVFLTGTRADFGKIKSLIKISLTDPNFEVHIFVTGMHVHKKYGYTVKEIEKSGFNNIHTYKNFNKEEGMDEILANTIHGFTKHIKMINPDMIVVHGDRVEALACSTVGALNHILTAHVEGGEVSGTIDDSIRHAITKLSHIHFIGSTSAKKRVSNMGEDIKNIYKI